MSKKQIKKFIFKFIYSVCVLLDAITALLKQSIQMALGMVVIFTFMAGLYFSINWVNDHVFSPFNECYNSTETCQVFGITLHE